MESEKMNNTKLTEKYKALSYDADVLRRRATRIEGFLGERELCTTTIFGCTTRSKPSLTEEIDGLKKTINMLLDYLDVVIQEKTTEKRIIKANTKTKKR